MGVLVHLQFSIVDDSTIYLRLCLAGNNEKLVVCKDRGAYVCINYKMEDFVKRVKKETSGKCIFFVILKPHFSSTVD